MPGGRDMQWLPICTPAFLFLRRTRLPVVQVFDIGHVISPVLLERAGDAGL